jgi:hypothetical protein
MRRHRFQLSQFINVAVELVGGGHIRTAFRDVSQVSCCITLEAGSRFEVKVEVELLL